MRDEAGTLGKIPVGGFSSTDPKTHRSFEAAQTALQRKRGDVLGFALPEDRSITVIDLDHCVIPGSDDPAMPLLENWAYAILDQFRNTFIQVSPSGTGLHIWLYGTKPGDRCTISMPNDGKIEIYDHARLVTVASVEPYTDALIAEMQDELDALYGELFPIKPEQPAQRSGEGVTLGDQELIAKASKADSAFAALYGGDWAGKKSASEADFTLAEKSAWWSNSDAAQIERIMRSSGLAREKWDKRDGQYGTYLARTIHRAIEANSGRCYSGAKGNFMGEQLAPASEDAPEQETTGATASKSANECCAQKDKIIAHLQRELKKKQARIEELEAAQRWEKKVRANKGVSATTKAVARTVIEFHQRAKPIAGQPEHLRKVWYEKIAKDAGVSESTVKTEIDKLVTMGALEKEHIREDSEKQKRRVTRALIAPTPVLLEKFETLEDPKHLNHGGDRRCPECGSMHLRIKTRTFYTCIECKHTWEKESAERIQRGNEDEMRARSDAMLAQDDFMGEQVAREDCPITSVQIETGQSSPREMAAKSGLNHHDERAEVLALVERLGYRTRIPVGIEQNVGGTLVNWQTFTAQADNSLIDSALQSLRTRAQAYREQVS